MRRYLLPLALLAATPVLAQDDDRGFIVGLIEDNLNAPGLTVRLDGFDGALSSTASVESLTVADDEGVWLRLEDVVLDWNRSALLRGRLEVEELSAGLISVVRAPLPAEGVEALPDAGATGFSLPNLPVSIDIDALRAERIELGAALLGQDATLTLEASGQLIDGSGAVTIAARRIDGGTGTYSIEASYAAEGQVLSIDLDIAEAQGGLVSTLTQLPGAPAIELTVRGDGPLDAFTADVALASDGEDRLSGQVALQGTDAGRRFDVDLSGDVTPLFAPRYRSFFGEDVSLAANGLQGDDGTLTLDALDLRTRALQLAGSARLGDDGWPTFIDITGRIEAADGTTVLLPTADNSQLRRADLTLQYDADVADDIALDLTLLDYTSPSVTFGEGQITATGAIRRDGGTVAGATAALAAAVDGLAFSDPALAQATGTRLSLDTTVDWATGDPVRLTGLALRGPDYSITGDVEVDGTDSELPVTLRLDLAADVQSLARFAALSGQDLSGSAEATVTGTAAPLAGTFDLNLEATTRDLALGIAQADALLSGETVLATAVRRTTEGTFVDDLELTSDQFTVDGSVTLLATESETYASGDRSTARLTATVADGTLFDPRLDGSIDLSVDVRQNEAGAWQGTLDASAPEGITVSADGTLTGDAPDVQFSAAVPRIEPFAPGIPGGATVTGRAFAEDGVWSVDVEGTGPWDLTASVDGPVTGPAPRIAFEAELPDLTAPVPALAQTPALRGPVALSGTLEQVDGRWVVDTSVDAPADITLRARGPVTGTPRIEIAGTVPEISALVPAIEGRIDLEATIAQEGQDWTAEATLRGPYDARVSARTTLTEDPLAVDFAADIDDLSPLAPVPGGLSVTGRAVRTDDGFTIDLDGTGPYDATIDATVDLADGTPAIVATGRIPDTSQLVPQLSGPLDYDVTAEQVDGQFRVTAQVDGAQAISASVEGIATGPEADLDFRLSVGNVAPFVPGLSGALNASGRVFQQGGNWAVDLDANGPLNATLTANGVLTGGAPQAEFTLAVPNIGPLLPDISGPLRVTGTAAQRGDAWNIDIDLAGPAGTTADVSGDVGTDGTLDLSIDGSAPLGLANAALSPRRLAGIARFDLALNGPAGLDALSGTITTSGAALVLPSLQNGLDAIDATVRLDDGTAQVTLTAAPQTGGRLSVDGPIALSGGFAADLAVDFDMTLADPRLYTADVAGNLRISGPLAGGALVAGTILVDGAEISVPSSGLTSIGDLPPIEFVGSPRPVRRTLERAGQTVDGRDPDAESSDGGGGYRLDLTISAPGRIFVRGRGLDAELGGQLRLTGTTSNPITAGGFELIRGRLDILEQRFDLDEGRISFQGDLTPFIRLVAVTQTDTITASIVIEGPANAIEVRFESTPEVPQEEIVAQIFFGRGLDQLSPLQAIQLANSIAVLAGRGSGGLLDSLRGTAGLDDLDITTDDDGNVALRAGKYVSDNVYTDVEVNQDGEATISLNLDVTPNLTVRGATGATGGTSLGLFYERDY